MGLSDSGLSRNRVLFVLALALGNKWYHNRCYDDNEDSESEENSKRED